MYRWPDLMEDKKVSDVEKKFGIEIVPKKIYRVNGDRAFGYNFHS